jgi:trigger factor
LAADRVFTIVVILYQKLRDKTLAGKKAIFDVEVLEASKRVVPEVTDEFAAKVKDGLTAESLLAELQKAVDQEDAKEFAPARNKALGEALAEVMNVDVPDTLVTNQAREKFAVMMAEMRDGGVSDDEIKKQINPENFLKYKNIVKDDIIRDFKISMATDEIARLEGINVPDYQIEEQVEAIKKDAAGSEDFDENMVRAKVQTALQRQAVMDWLAERSNLEVEYKEEEEQFDEALMEKLAEESVKREEELLKGKSPTAAAPSPVAVATEQPKEASAAAAVDDENLSLEEKAFRALLNTGAVELHKSPDDPDYDHSKDDEIAVENRMKQ